MMSYMISLSVDSHLNIYTQHTQLFRQGKSKKVRDSVCVYVCVAAD